MYPHHYLQVSQAPYHTPVPSYLYKTPIGVWQTCRGSLKDMVLDWDDALPDDKLDASEVHAREADLVICLGTSLQIRPICNLPNVAKRNGGRVAIVNLQKTPKNKIADLVIHGKCDEVLQQVMQALGRPLPVYERWDRCGNQQEPVVALSSFRTEKEGGNHPKSTIQYGK